MRPAKGTEGEDKSVSESVKIGGIGKNPAVDKINSLQAIDIKGCAVRRMQEAVQGGNPHGSAAYRKAIPVSLEKVEWEGKPDGREQGKGRMAGSVLSGRQITAEDPGRVWQAVGRVDGGAFSGCPKTTGSIQQPGKKRDPYL